jgi:hypothetical protein
VLYDTDGFWSVTSPTSLDVLSGVSKVRLKGKLLSE